MDPYPESQSLELVPVMQAVLADIQSRNVMYPKQTPFTPSATVYPPPDTDTGLAYFLAIYEKNAHMKFQRLDVGGNIELIFGTGGYQYGPRRVLGRMVLPVAFTDLISLFAVFWITFQLGYLYERSWNLQLLKTYYTSTVANPLYTNLLRTFCFTVLGIAEDSFTSIINNVGHLTDYDDQ
jgi:hypothetical protein